MHMQIERWQGLNINIQQGRTKTKKPFRKKTIKDTLSGQHLYDRTVINIHVPNNNFNKAKLDMQGEGKKIHKE